MSDDRAMTPRYADVFLDAFRLFVGQGKRYSCEALAAATRLPVRNIKAYLTGETLPSREAEWALKRVLPTEFTDALLAPCGLGLTRRIDSEDAVGPFAMQRDLGREIAELAEALADGRLDHSEAAKLVPHFRAIASECERFAETLEREFKPRCRR
jgi:hypothetical protein